MNESYDLTLPNLVFAFANWMLLPDRSDGREPEPDSTVVLAVHAHPGASIGEIASLLQLTHSGAVRIVDRLQAGGAVLRTEGADRRRVALALTEQGRKRAERLLAVRRLTIEDRLARLSPEEAEKMAALLRQLLDGAARHRAHAWQLCRYCDHSICQGENCAVGRHLE